MLFFHALDHIKTVHGAANSAVGKKPRNHMNIRLPLNQEKGMNIPYNLRIMYSHTDQRTVGEIAMRGQTRTCTDQLPPKTPPAGLESSPVRKNPLARS
jgi:hypothetical protein